MPKAGANRLPVRPVGHPRDAGARKLRGVRHQRPFAVGARLRRLRLRDAEDLHQRPDAAPRRDRVEAEPVAEVVGLRNRFEVVDVEVRPEHRHRLELGPLPAADHGAGRVDQLGLPRAANRALVAGAPPDRDRRVRGEGLSSDPLDAFRLVAGVAEVAVDEFVVLRQHPEEPGRSHRGEDPELLGRLREFSEPQLHVGLVDRARDVLRAKRFGRGGFHRHRPRDRNRDQVLRAEDRPAAPAAERAPLVVHDRRNRGEPPSRRADRHHAHPAAVAGLESLGDRLHVVEIGLGRGVEPHAAGVDEEDHRVGRAPGHDHRVVARPLELDAPPAAAVGRSDPAGERRLEVGVESRARRDRRAVGRRRRQHERVLGPERIDGEERVPVAVAKAQEPFDQEGGPEAAAAEEQFGETLVERVCAGRARGEVHLEHAPHGA